MWKSSSQASLLFNSCRNHATSQLPKTVFKLPHIHKKHTMLLRKTEKNCKVTCKNYYDIAESTLTKFTSSEPISVPISNINGDVMTNSRAIDNVDYTTSTANNKKQVTVAVFSCVCKRENINTSDWPLHIDCQPSTSMAMLGDTALAVNTHGSNKSLNLLNLSSLQEKTPGVERDFSNLEMCSNVTLDDPATARYGNRIHPTVTYGSKKSMLLTHISSCSKGLNKTKVNYNCTVCGQNEMTLEEMLKHIKCKFALSRKKILPGETFKCSQCGKLYKNEIVYRTHVMMHTGVQPYQCSKESCNKGFVFKTSLKKHLLLEHNEFLKDYKCEICNKLFSVDSNRRNHQARHDSSDTKMKKRLYLCSICGKYFTTPSNLKTHELSVHATQPKKHTCDICGMGFHLKNALKTHIKRHAGIKNYVCETCGATFIREHELQMHQACHSDNRPFHCKICDKSFKRLRNLKSHEAWVHEILPVGVKTFSCELCGKELATKKKLASHTAAHSSMRQYSCDKCDGVFALKKLLSQHKRQTHFTLKCKKTILGETKFACNKCDKVFKGRPNLSQHLRKVHYKDKYSLRKFPCPHCGKVFNFKNSLDEHVRIHLGLKPYCCETCYKKFRTWGDLHRHKQTHTDLKPFSCETCSKQFRRRCHLHVHMRVHTGLKPYVCDICGRAFTYNNERVKHCNKTHNIPNLQKHETHTIL